MELLLRRLSGEYGFEVVNQTGQQIRFDAAEEIVGLGFGVRPMEALASSLAACASIDVLLILKKQKVIPENFEVKIDAVRKEGIPGVFKSIHLDFLFQTDASLERIQKAVNLSLDKYCSVAKILSPTCEITYTISLIK